MDLNCQIFINLDSGWRFSILTKLVLYLASCYWALTQGPSHSWRSSQVFLKILSQLHKNGKLLSSKCKEKWFLLHVSEHTNFSSSIFKTLRFNSIFLNSALFFPPPVFLSLYHSMCWKHLLLFHKCILFASFNSSNQNESPFQPNSSMLCPQETPH